MMFNYFFMLGLPFMILAQAAPTDIDGFHLTIVGQLCILITTIFGIVIQVYRENRARRWAKEDAAALEKKVIEAEERQKQHTEKIVRHVGNNVSQQVANKALEAEQARTALAAEVHLNTEITKVIAANGGHKDDVQKVEVVNADKSPPPTEVIVINTNTEPVPTEVVKPKEK